MKEECPQCARLRKRLQDQEEIERLLAEGIDHLLRIIGHEEADLRRRAIEAYKRNQANKEKTRKGK